MVVLLKIYNYGIIDLRELDLNRKFIQVISQEYEMNNFQNSKKIKLSNFFNMEEAISFIKNEVKFISKESDVIEESLIASLDYNVTFNSHYTDMLLNEEFKKISPKKCLFKKCDLIVKKKSIYR